MPTISVSKKDLESLLQTSLSLEELEKSLQLVKGEIKLIEKDALRIELSDTNRPDLLSVEGIARQIRREKRNKIIKKQEVKNEIIVDSELKNIRPYIGGFLATGIPIDESTLLALIETQEKLSDVFGKRRKNIAIGVYDAEKIEFPVHYRAVTPESRKFIPLHNDPVNSDCELNLSEILNKHPKGKEYKYILQNCKKFPFLEDNEGKVLSFPPIINSKLTGEVTPGIQNIFCEVTGKNLSQLLLVINILAENFKDRGFKIYPCLIKYSYETDFGKDIITPYQFEDTSLVHQQKFEHLLGLKLEKEEIKEHLEQMGYFVEIDKDNFKITSPSYRKDIMHTVDIIEDFAISRGYDSFSPAPLEEFTIGKSRKIEKIIHKTREIMIGCGFVEVISNILDSPTNFVSNMELPPSNIIELENPVAESYGVLRNSIIPSLLQVEAQSSKATYPHQIFEIGEVVCKTDSQTAPTLVKLAAMIAHSNANFSELHSFLDHLAYYLGFSYKLKKINHPSFIKGRIGNIEVNTTPKSSLQGEIGILGEIHPKVLENFKIKYPISVFELSLSFLNQE